MKIDYNILIKELIEASQAYYQGNAEIMTDIEYDTKLEFLEDLVDNGELELTDKIKQLLNVVASGTTPDEVTTVLHDHPMLSLGKAKDYDELTKYHERAVKAGANGFSLEMKLDGLALSAKYVNGIRTQLSTRGDGVKGELLNHLLDNDRVFITGLPKVLNAKHDLELRGELYISDEQFEIINVNRELVTGERFSNPRNAVTGIVRGSIKGISYDAEISFTAYSVFQNDKQLAFDEIIKDEDVSRVDQLTLTHLLKDLTTKLKSCKVNSVDFKNLKVMVEQFGEARTRFAIPTDGVVIKPINEIEMLNKMGYTSRHPIAFVAFKYPGAKAITTVLDIIVSVGKTGKLTPQAVLEPVTVNGVTISRATCSNYNWLDAMGIRIGSTVAVTRANDVIPAIDVVVDKGPNNAIVAPVDCPECGSLLVGDGTNHPKTLECKNEDCPSRLFNYIKSIVGRDFLYIDSLGDVAIEALVDQDIVNGIVDLFKLTEETLATVPTGTTSTGNVRMLGAGNAKNIIQSIENSKINTDSNKLLAALNIKGVGPGTSKRLIAHFGGLQNVLDVEPSRLSEVNQVGQSVIEAFIEHGERVKSQLAELIELGFIINDPIINETPTETKGTFSVSGSNKSFESQADLVSHMEALGWEYHKSPKKNTDVLFADPNGTSNKIIKARKDGVRIIDDINNL